MTEGDSWELLASSLLERPIKIKQYNRIMYRELKKTPAKVAKRKMGPKPSLIAINISSLLKKPLKGIIPAKDRQPIKKVTDVTDIFLLNPPIFQQSVSPFIPCITLPAPRNKSAFENPCTTK